MSGRRGPSPAEEHRVFDELAVGWALHALEPEDETLFLEHLPGCRRCAQTVADTEELMAAMAADLPRAEPSAQLHDRLHAAVADTEQVAPAPDDEPTETARPAATGFPGYTPVDPPERVRPPARRRVVALALAAAAVATIVGLGIWNVFLADSRDDMQATLAEQQRIVDALLAPGDARIAALSAEDGLAVATVVARSDRVDVVTYGLEVNDASEETYVVWGLDGAEPEAIGTFDVTRSQMAVQTVGSGRTGLDDYSGYGISLEPGREAPPAPTEIVALG
jgi:Anti-sigma-K factor rskA